MLKTGILLRIAVEYFTMNTRETVIAKTFSAAFTMPTLPIFAIHVAIGIGKAVGLRGVVAIVTVVVVVVAAAAGAALP
jgi:hypothetical protein